MSYQATLVVCWLVKHQDVAHEEPRADSAGVIFHAVANHLALVRKAEYSFSDYRKRRRGCEWAGDVLGGRESRPNTGEGSAVNVASRLASTEPREKKAIKDSGITAVCISMTAPRTRETCVN